MNLVEKKSDHSYWTLKELPMSKSQDSKKAVKKPALKTAKEKKQEKREKKNGKE